jgi:taurine dioxygenase
MSIVDNRTVHYHSLSLPLALRSVARHILAYGVRLLSPLRDTTVAHEALADSYTTKCSGLTVRKLSEHLGASVEGVDLSAPITDKTYQDIFDTWITHSVLVFRDQELAPAMHVDFSSRFGELVGHVVSRFGLADYPQVTILSNVENDQGQKIGADRAGMIWHSDLSFMACPSLGSFLYGVECPPSGGDTEFASTRAAFSALPSTLAKRLAGLHGIHDYAWHYRTYLSHRPQLSDAQKAKTPPVHHPALRTHPVTGAATIYLSEGLTASIEELPEDEGRSLVVEVSDFATQPQFVYRHQWQPRDLVVWDNRSTMHRATDFDQRYRRLMRRTTVTGDRPFFAGSASVPGTERA